MRQVEAAEPVVLQPRTVLSDSSEPGRNCGVAMPEHADGCGNIQSFSQRG